MSLGWGIARKAGLAGGMACLADMIVYSFEGILTHVRASFAGIVLYLVRINSK